ncbi:MAG: TonB-dependent receptor [Phycisphaerales bacterium]|nr:TonB-dependent receptor [Phycisphaerales bacterium]
MCKVIGVCCFLFVFYSSSAQSFYETDTNHLSATDLDAVVVWGTIFPEKTKYISQTIKVLKDPNQLSLQPNTADVLLNSGAVYVQKSQEGGGSPIIRGFEASRILLNVDGIRMNNAIYRAGHLQNIITVDNLSLERIEVWYGPASTLYGSDALGGVVNMYTKNPVLSSSKKPLFTGNVVYRYASAINEQRGHIDFNVGGKKWAWVSSVTYGSFGDVMQGNYRPNLPANFGQKPFVVQRINNRDTALPNPNPNKQSPTGYAQVDIVEKILFQPNKNSQHILNWQYSRSTNIPRYDRLTDTLKGLPVYAEYYYGPQIRNLIAYHFNNQQQGYFFNQLKVVASYQDIYESRVSRKFNSNNKTYNYERVSVFGGNFDLQHLDQQHELHIGVESYNNFVRSTAEGVNILTQATFAVQTRYADGPTQMGYQALYAQHAWKFHKRWTLNDGLRVSFVRLNAVFSDTSLLGIPFTQDIQTNIAPTGNIGLVYTTPKNFRIAFLTSSGFRSPNVDDLTKVFESKPGTLIVPNQNVKPEYTYNTEINFNRYGSKFNFGGSVFYTWFVNALVVSPFTWNGSDSVLYEGVKSAVYAPQNKASAYITGASANIAWEFVKRTFIEGVVTYTYGRYFQNGREVPLDHVPPIYGRVSIKHVRRLWSASIYSLFNGAKTLQNYSPSGEDNLQYATANGLPAWGTLNVSGSIFLAKHLLINFQAENLLNMNYRYFASGISAPGLNFIVSLRASL